MTILGEDFSWLLRPAEVNAFAMDEGTGIVFEDPSVTITERIISDVLHPRCFAFVPQNPNGRAVVVLAGGGYTKLVVGKEGIEVARWLTSLGFHAFVLVHRFPCARFTDDDRSGSQAPLDDAIESMRQIRSRAGEFGIDPRGIGVLGLSSGGHLAACLIADYPAQWQPPASEYANVDSRPDFLIVGYGPISTNATGRTVIPNKPALPPAEKQALYEATQPDIQLLASPPPTFIVYAANDPVVPVENALRLYAALLRQGVAPELHIFSDAPHGFALREANLPVGTWPLLCRAWLRQQGFCG